MKLYRAHDGLSLSLPAPPAATATLDDLVDCLSLATGISSDQLLCLTADGSQLHGDNYRTLLLSLDASQNDADVEFFLFNLEHLSAEPTQLAQQLALPVHLEPPLRHIDELPEPGSPTYSAAVQQWAQHALSLIRTHAARAHVAHAALTNMHRASAIALANLLQYTRTISAGADALNNTVGAELARMKDLLDGYERDLNILGMVPIDPRLLNPSTRDAASTSSNRPGQQAGGQPSSSSPASTPSSQGHGIPTATTAGPSKRLGDYVSRHRMSAVAKACAGVHAELSIRFANLYHRFDALQTDVRALEAEVHAVDLGPVTDAAETAREARLRAEDIVERGLLPWLNGSLLQNDAELDRLTRQGHLPPFPLAAPGAAPSPGQGVGLAVEHDQERLHSQLEEALTELVLLDEVTRASVLRLSQDRNDMQARNITFLQDISVVQSDLGELAESMDLIEKEEMPPGAALRQNIMAQQFAQARAQHTALANSKALAQQHQLGHQTPTSAAQLFVGQQGGPATSALHHTKGAFVIDGFRPNMAPVVEAAAGAGVGIGTILPGSASTTSHAGATAGGGPRPIGIDGFRHLARLHNMLLAYGATLIELVRRATFSRLFLKSAQSVAELMALVSEREVERRKEWRKAGVGALLPWDVRALSLVPLSGSAAAGGGGGGGMMAASAVGDEGTPVLEISTKGMIPLHALSGAGGSTGFDPLAAALAAAAELGREDVDRLFALLDDIERALDQEAEVARDQQAAAVVRRRSSAMRHPSAGGSFALSHGRQSPATPPTLQSPAEPTVSLPTSTNPIPAVRAALRFLVDEIDYMEPEFKDLVNVTLLERKSRLRRRRGSRRVTSGAAGGYTTGEGNDDQESDAEDDESDDEEGVADSVLNGTGRGAGVNPTTRTSRRALRRQVKELNGRVQELEAAAAAAHASLEAAQAENHRLRANLAHLSEEHHASHAAIRVELEAARAESRANAEAYDRARHARDDALAQADTLRNDVDTETARRHNLEEEVTNVRRDLKEARKDEAEAKREALELEERLAELEVQTSELQHELDNAVRAREDVCSRMEGLLKEGSSAEQQLATAQARIEELNREASAARTEVREAKEALAEAENARDKLIRTYRAEADGDRAILEENVRNKDQELRLAREGLKNAEIARKAAEGREAAERTVSDGLRGQLEAADVAHETMLRDLEEAREEGTRLEARLREAVDERDELLRLVRPLMGKVHALRKVIKAMPTPTSRSAATADKEGKGANGTGDSGVRSRERSSSSTLAVNEVTNGPANGTNQVSSTSTIKSNSILSAAMEAFENEGDNAGLATTLSALRALEPRIFHDEVKGKLDSLTTLVRKWQKAYKGAQDKIARAQAAARDRIAYRNFQVGDLVLFLPTRNTSARTFAAFNRGYPHYFLRAEGAFGEQVRSKEYLLDRIVAVTERVAGSGLGGGVPTSGEGSADGTNPYQLAEGMRYHILDVEGASASNASSSSAPQTPASRSGSRVARSVSHGAPSRRNSSVTAVSSSLSSSASSPVGPTSLPSDGDDAASTTSKPAGGATAPVGPVAPGSSAPSSMTRSRSASRSLDRVTSSMTASAEYGRISGSASGSGSVSGAVGASTATITPLTNLGAAAMGSSPNEGNGFSNGSGSVPIPAFGTRMRGAGVGALKRRAPGDGVEGGSTSTSPGTGTGTSTATATAMSATPSAPLPISAPRGGGRASTSASSRGGSVGSAAIPMGGGSKSAGGSSLSSKVPTAAEFERGLKGSSTSRAIAEALAAEGLQSVGNPFSASPSGVGSLLERNLSFGTRPSLSTPPLQTSPSPSPSPLRAPQDASTMTTSASTSNHPLSAQEQRRGQTGSSSSSRTTSSTGSNLARARREGGAFRRSGKWGTPPFARTGLLPSGSRGGMVVTTTAAASPASSSLAGAAALAVKSLETARGETVSGGGGGGGSRAPSSVGVSGAGLASPSPSPSPSARLVRQLSSGGGSSGFSERGPALSSASSHPQDGGLGLVGAQLAHSPGRSQGGSSSGVAFPRTGPASSQAVGSGGGSLGRSRGSSAAAATGPSTRKDSFGSGFLASLTFGRASARKASLQGGGAGGGGGGMEEAVVSSGNPRRSTLEMILGWPTGADSPVNKSGKGKERALREAASEGMLGEDEASPFPEAGSPGSEAGSATAAEMLRRLARS